MQKLFRYIMFLLSAFIMLQSTNALADHKFTYPSEPGSLITNYRASYNNSSFYFSFTNTVFVPFNRVYIDTTRDPSTGFPIGKIGAKFLIENNSLYEYIGPNWNWRFIKTINYTNNNLTPSWGIARSDLGYTDCGGSFDFVFQSENNGIFYTSNRMTMIYTANPSCPAAVSQKIAVPSYFYPCTGTNCYWTQLNNSAAKVNIAIINPGSGPGNAPDPNYVNQTKQTQQKGISVIGYLTSSYGARSIAAVESDIDKFYNWYGVDGIFIDEGYSADCSKADYYSTLDSYVKAKGGKGITVVNYGTNTPECYVNSSTILVNFESPYSSYMNWTPAAWVSKYPAARFWHIVYATQQDDVVNAVRLAKARNGGYVYMTPDTLPNPYDTLPPSNYWNLEMGALS